MTPQAIDLLLTHALTVTQDAQRRVLPESSLAAHNGRILAVDPTPDLSAREATVLIHLPCTTKTSSPCGRAGADVYPWLG